MFLSAKENDRIHDVRGMMLGARAVVSRKISMLPEKHSWPRAMIALSCPAHAAISACAY
jgi:hypothetical protein